MKHLFGILCRAVPKSLFHLRVSAEGFQSWMWRGLTFLLPFLFFGHVSPNVTSFIFFSLHLFDIKLQLYRLTFINKCITIRRCLYFAIHFTAVFNLQKVHKWMLLLRAFLILLFETASAEEVDVDGSEMCLCNQVVRQHWRLMPPLPSQFWQLYNSVTLFRLGRRQDCKEWQVRNPHALFKCSRVISRKTGGVGRSVTGFLKSLLPFLFLSRGHTNASQASSELATRVKTCAGSLSPSNWCSPHAWHRF